jgi:hypothetical protein
MRAIVIFLERWLPRRARHGEHRHSNHLVPLSLVLILGGLPIAVGAGYIGWSETESILFAALCAGLPSLLVLAGLFSLTD